MRIDAIIGDVRYLINGTAQLTLTGRPGGRQPNGPVILIVENPPASPLLYEAEGCAVTGDWRYILMGDTIWADRLGGRTIRLRPKA